MRQRRNSGQDREREGTPILTRRRAAATAFGLRWLSIALIPAPAVAQQISDDWQFAATIYAWLPDIGGHTQFPLGGGSSIDVDVSTILDHLKMGGQASFEVQKGPWGAYTDLVYLDVGASKSETRNISIRDEPLPAGVTTAASFDLKSVIWTLGGSYRIASTPATTVDVLAGARLASFEQSFDWKFTGDLGPIEPPPRSGSRDISVDQWDAIVGIKGRFAFGPDRVWSVPYYVDIGSGDSDLTWQGVLGLTYAFGWGDLSVAWRYLDYDLSAGSPIKNLNFNGPALGATFRW